MLLPRFLRLGVISSCRRLSRPPLEGCLPLPGRHRLHTAWHQQRTKALTGQRVQLLGLQQIAGQHSRVPHWPQVKAPLSASLAAPTVT